MSAGWRAKEWSAQKAENPRSEQVSDTIPVLCCRTTSFLRCRTTSFLRDYWCESMLKNGTIWSPICVGNVNTATEGGRSWWGPGSNPTSISCSILVTSLLVNADSILCGLSPWFLCPTCKLNVATPIQTQPEVCITSFLGISQYNQVYS